MSVVGQRKSKKKAKRQGIVLVGFFPGAVKPVVVILITVLLVGTFILHSPQPTPLGAKRRAKKANKARNSPGGVRTHGIRITQMCVIQVTFVNYIRTARYHCATGLKRPWTEDLGIF
jgi:hypothetical protein